MKHQLSQTDDYKAWFASVKNQIQQRQIKAAIAVNSELIVLYWYLGYEIICKQEHAKWGSALLTTPSKDLQREFPKVSGFSKRNLELIWQWYQFYNTTNLPIAKQLVSQINEPVALLWNVGLIGLK